MNPHRAPWGDGFPDAAILASESAVKQHPEYRAAKTGDASAAVRLVRQLVSDEAIDALGRELRDSLPIVAVSTHKRGTASTRFPRRLRCGSPSGSG